MIEMLAIPYMTWLSRMAGGGWPKLQWGLDQWLLAAPYLAFYPIISYWAIPAYLAAVLGLRLGHGRGFDYWKPFKSESEPEKVEYLIPECLPVWVRKFLIMFLTGWAVTLVLSLTLMLHGHYLAGVILAASGAAKSCAYFFPRTEWAEYCRGLSLGIGLVLALYLL